MSLIEGYVVVQEIQTFMKVYPSFTRLFKYANPVNINRFDWGPRKSYQGDKKKNSKYVIDPEEAERQSLWRARTNFLDIALSNEFDLFVTFTFAKNRYDVDLLKRKMAYWLNNQRILHGNFAYLIVPEYHKDGALHFHALFQGYKGDIESSGIFKKGREVFNIKSYRGGHTEAYKIDNLRKTAAYLAKYLSKDMPKFKGKQRYWCSNGLLRPIKVVNPVLTEADKDKFLSVFSDRNKEIFELAGPLPQADLIRMSDKTQIPYDDLFVADM